MSKTVHCDMYLLYRQKVDSAEREPINALLESLAASCYKVGLTNKYLAFKRSYFYNTICRPNLTDTLRDVKLAKVLRTVLDLSYSTVRI